jgi:beta-lactamase regulating signal transducer with metallopeptidase domain
VAWWLFQNVVITAALAAVVMAVCRVTRIGPVARHALWLVVLLKFVTPPIVEWPWTVPDPLGVSALDAGAGSSVDRARGVDAEIDDEMRAREGDRHPQPPSAPQPRGDGRDDLSHLATGFGWSWILWLWAAGSLSMAAVEGVRLVRIGRQVAASAPGDHRIVDRVAVLSARMGLRPVAVRTMSGISSPMVWCVGRPRLLWPASLAAEASAACIDGVIVHELAHVKRRDHVVGWIELAAAVIWWWNPFFWLTRSALREQAELACDAWVISALPDGRQAYAESLLALSGALIVRNTTRSMAVVGIRPGSRRALERRLVMIMKGRAPLRLPLAGILALALMAAATLPAWATGSAQEPPPPPPPAAPAAPIKQGRDVPPPPPPAPATPYRLQNVPPPPPPAAPAAPVLRTQNMPPPPPPQRQVRRSVAVPPAKNLRIDLQRSALPQEGRQLIETFTKDREDIQQEAERKLTERRTALIKELEALQEQYTKAGRLDDAVAIRDYLRAGGPPRDLVMSIGGKFYSLRKR